MKATKERFKAQTIKVGAFEDYLDYQTLLNFHDQGLEVGAFVLQSGAKKDWCFTFGFSCEGIHSFLSIEELEKVFDELSAGLKALVPGERFTVRLGAYHTDAIRQQELSELGLHCDSEEIDFILSGERQRIGQLSRIGFREPKTLTIYITYHLRFSKKVYHWLDRFGHWWQRFWDKFLGRSGQIQKEEIAQKFRQVWINGYIQYFQMLRNQLNLIVRPMNATQLWEHQWFLVNSEGTPPLPVPQQIDIYTHNWTWEEKIFYRTHGAALLCGSGKIELKENYVRVGNTYIGLLTFWEKPGGWDDKKSQLSYLWKVIAKDSVTDTDIITQIVPSNAGRVRRLIRDNTRYSHNKSRSLEKRNRMDVSAGINAESGIKAQREILLGNPPYYCATVIVVRRSSLEDLEVACQNIKNCFPPPAVVEREPYLTWKYWLETLPVQDQDLLGRRRHLYLTSEVSGFLPLMQTISRDNKGLELIGEDGGTPVFIDIFSQSNDKQRHILVLGTTRSGKSVLVAGLLLQALAHRVPIVAIDYPKPDGTSTYTAFTEFLGQKRGSYFNVGPMQLNLMDRPDLRGIDPAEAQLRMKDLKEFLCNCLLIMVLGGDTSDELFKNRVKAILYRSINSFYNDREIQERFDEAELAGFESHQWTNIPTLRDFLKHFLQLCEQNYFSSFGNSEEKFQQNNLIPVTTIDPLIAQLLHNLNKTTKGQSLIERAIEQIKQMLSYWINDSSVGQAISSPSSFVTEAELMVFAMRQVTDSLDAAVLSLVSYAEALRRAMKYPMSIFFMDESPILFKFKSIRELVASLISNGSKSGIRVVLCAQDPNSIYNTDQGAQIFQNFQIRIIGRIERVAIESCTNILQYPREYMIRCFKFRPNPQYLYTCWLTELYGQVTFCRYYPGSILLALVANNQYEQNIRSIFYQVYPDKYLAITRFAQALEESIRSGQDLDTVKEKFLPPNYQQCLDSNFLALAS